MGNIKNPIPTDWQGVYDGTETNLQKIIPGRYHYETLDSGKREEFKTGSVRDTRDGKGRFDLVPTKPLRRLAGLYERGASKYGDRNWEKGQPSSRYYDSCMRHLISYMEGERTEDHLAAVAWNAFAMMWNEEEHKELDDITKEK